jgi:hypothetical protein
MTWTFHSAMTGSFHSVLKSFTFKELRLSTDGKEVALVSREKGMGASNELNAKVVVVA